MLLSHVSFSQKITYSRDFNGNTVAKDQYGNTVATRSTNFNGDYVWKDQ